ncbi:hypothetical protein [Frigoribacterium sp. CG_9.8]|uniref:hypothetical protein n=1 Tax=Frigoribacterium sp. CG_9.8 TaxID=2787733 RepID=UPI0018CABABD|nr:hypothetical protein [Frigoribacterium sp. CG_9.8]MBG6107103.1 hypothetical protein [Frigoribacterium sp. CG_9.8]
MSTATASHAEWFLVDASGLCRWIIRHQVTEELAGTVTRTPVGYALSDDTGCRIGSFATLDRAVEGLYDFV